MEIVALLQAAHDALDNRTFEWDERSGRSCCRECDGGGRFYEPLEHDADCPLAKLLLDLQSHINQLKGAEK